MSENKTNITALNTLKSWFKTGLKPTQSQFWAWLDSFWHKDEKIPISNIEGMDKALESKAEITAVEVKADKTAVEAKANLDASGLSEGNIISWKEALGVGELPPNIATIDKDSEQGNVYTKAKVDELLESSGKNFSNTDLNIIQARRHSIATGASLEIDTAGNVFKISGLADKTSDNTFNKILKTNEQGQVGLGEALVFNFPSQLTVNNIGINNIPDVNTLAQRFGDRLTEVHSSPKKKFSNWSIKTFNDISSGNIRVDNNSIIYTTVEPFKDADVGTLIISIYSERVLPMNKDWFVKFNVKMGHNGTLHYSQSGSVTARKIGLYSSVSDTIIEPNIYVYDGGGDFGTNILHLLSSGPGKKYSSRSGKNTAEVVYTANSDAVIGISIIKVGDVILLQSQYGNTGLSEVYSAGSMGFGDFGFCVSVSQPASMKNTIGLVSDVEYLILN